MKEIMLVCATRMSREAFKKSAPLSNSIKKLRNSAPKVTSKITYQNRKGLGTIYNRYLKARHADKILVFVHDDVRIEDLFVVEKLNEALKTFDVVGVAGNKEPDHNYPSWFDQRRPLSGFVAHVTGKPSAIKPETVFVSSYGPTPDECGPLDGLFIAVNTESILSRDVKFDEQFEFHFYDLDFSRTCLRKDLHLGTGRSGLFTKAVAHSIQFNGRKQRNCIEINGIWSLPPVSDLTVLVIRILSLQ